MLLSLSSTFTTALDQVGKFSDSDKQLLQEKLTYVSFQPSAFLLKDGQHCRDIFFVDQGCCRQFVVNEKGDDVTMDLFVEGDWVLDYKSFTSQTPAVSFIQAIEEISVYRLNVHDLHWLMQHSQSFFMLARIFQHALTKNEMNPHNYSPLERYVNLLKNKPRVLQKFQLKHVASFLDMTPETLSSVRKQAITAVN
jgi:CRP-like cAMP-binding protein